MAGAKFSSRKGKLVNSRTDNLIFIIAEGADAHYGDMDRAKLMCRLALKSQANAIKFQHHLPDQEMLREIPTSSNMKEPLYDFLVKNALSIEQHVELSNYCKEIGIEYLCTPFSWAAAKELEDAIGPRMYKIGSGELTDLPTLEKIASFGKPMIVSTGMSEIWEIERTYNLLIDKVPQLILMNCTSAYPPTLGDVRLGVISKLQSLFPRALIGHSDHTNSIYTSIGAMSLGAKYIEKHVTVDEDLEGPDQLVSISFSELEKLVDASKIISNSLSAEKTLLESEKPIQAWARRSLVYLKNLNEGEKIKEGDIWGKRPGTGIPSANLNEYLGKTLSRGVSKDTLVSKEDFPKTE